jgi:hypothetical protein
MIKNIGTQGKG